MRPTGGEPKVIWTKTDAGKSEMQTRLLVKDRAQRNLLLLIDGVKSDAVLLASVSSVTAASFETLQSLGLIAPTIAATPKAPVAATAAVATEPAAPLDYAQFTTTLTQLISSELGLRGFMLTLAVDKASTIEGLMDVADKVIEQIRDRKGPARADKASRALYGG